MHREALKKRIYYKEAYIPKVPERRIKTNKLKWLQEQTIYTDMPPNYYS